jgi:outer membrane lipoprotein-sorting protein
MVLRTILCGFFFYLDAFAVDVSEKVMTQQIEVYLNGIQALKSDFIQTNPNGATVQGRLWLQRTPGTFGKLRLDYDPKAQLRVVSVDENLTIYDLSDNSETNVSVSSTPAAFILQQAISLQENLQVVNLSMDGLHEIVRIKLVRQGDDHNGPSLTLFFSLYETGGIKTLERWEVVDMQGQETKVDLIPETLVINSQDLVPDNIFHPPFQNQTLTSLSYQGK